MILLYIAEMPAEYMWCIYALYYIFEYVFPHFSV